MALSRTDLRLSRFAGLSSLPEVRVVTKHWQVQPIDRCLIQPGIPEHMRPTIALVTAGVEMDVLGIAYHDFSQEQRAHVCTCHPRETNFKENIIDHFASAIIKKPLTTFGNVKADVLALKDMHYIRQNFCAIILGSAWPN